MADLEEQKKVVLPYMQRAQEVQQADPKVAYYCRLYALEEAMKLPQRHKTINDLLIATMAQLEKDKQKLSLDPELDRPHLETFGLKIFANADRVDRAGRANENTAKAFYASSIFIDVLNHFGDVDADMVEKQRYAVWRAAEIRKAIREGRPPLPPAAPEDTLDMTGLGDSTIPSSQGQGQLPDISSMQITDVDGLCSAPEGPSQSALPPPMHPSQGNTSLPSPGPPQAPFSQPFAPHGLASFDELPSAPGAPSSASASGVSAAFFDVPMVHSGSRFKQGSKVMYFAPGSPGPEPGTVGQVLTGPDGTPRYRVALRERLVDAEDHELAAQVTEGQTVTYLSPMGPVPASVIMVQDMSWPPSYLIKPDNTKELAAEYFFVSLLTPEECQAAAAAAPPAVPQPPVLYTSPPPPPAAVQPHPHQPAHAAAAAPPPAPVARSPGHSYGAAAHAAPPPSSPPTQTYSGYNHPPPPTHASHAQGPAHHQAPAASYGYGQPAASAAGISSSIMTATPQGKPPLAAIQEAQKKARYAVSALSFEDVSTAVENLQMALRLLLQQQ